MKFFKIPGEGPDFKPSRLLRILWYLSDAMILAVILMLILVATQSCLHIARFLAIVFLLGVPLYAETRMYVNEKLRK